MQNTQKGTKTNIDICFNSGKINGRRISGRKLGLFGRSNNRISAKLLVN